MAAITSLCVYCGASEGRDRIHAETARSLGEAMAQRGITLVYGGGGIGLMAVVAEAVLANGGSAVGLVPKHFAIIEPLHTESTVLCDRLDTVITSTMHRRKQEMFERSDGFVVLPGGFGTLDEFFEVLTWRQIGLHDKPIVVFDAGGYWELLWDLLDHAVEQGFTSRAARDLIVVARSIDELFRALDEAPEPTSRSLASDFRF